MSCRGMNSNVYFYEHFLCMACGTVFQEDIKLFQYLIDYDYRVHMQLDNLPVAIREER